MAQYDDFGRPIYETAEEYNKAHKGGVCPRPYDSPTGDNYQHNTTKEKNHYQTVAQRYTNRENSKKAKTMVIGLVVFFIVLNVVIIFSIFQMVGGSFGDIEIGYEEEQWGDMVGTETVGEYIGAADVPLPEGFETFSYNGQTYTLPTSYQEILQMGFTLEEDYDINDLFPTEYEELLAFVDDADGFTSAMIRINNYTGDDIPLGKCMVDYFYIENPVAFDKAEQVPDFMFGDGLTFESSYEELEAYFGVPYYHYEDHSEEGYYYDSYEWAYYGEDEIHFVSITFWNGVIDNVGIEKRAYEEKY